MIYESLGSTPIKPDQPAGSDVRGLPEYEALNSELEKANSLAATSAINWKNVLEPASALLATHGKDFQVGCYLAVALTQVQGLPGFSIGLKILSDMVQNFWETMFPPVARIRGRRNALEWWAERTLSALEALKSDTLQMDDLKVMKERLAHLDKMLRDKDPDAPSINRISAIVNGLSAVEPPKPVEPKESAAASSNGAAPAAQISAIEGPIENIDKAIGIALANLARIAAQLLETDIVNPLAYRLSRIACWSQIEQLPPLNNGRTMIPPPASQLRDMLKTLIGGGQAEAVVTFAESRLSEYPFWLDLNRITVEGLAKMGDRAAAAMQTVQAETAILLQRMPDIEVAAFDDGSRFADFDTATWLAGLAKGGEGNKSSSGGGDDPLGEAGREALDLLGQGRILEGVDKLEAVGRGSGSGRVRFVARMKLCESLLSRDGNRDLRPYLAQLMSEIDLHHLENWDPTLAAQALMLVYRATPVEPLPGTTLPARPEILHRIAQIDFGRALRVSGE